MSGTELLIIILGLCIGYWVVAKLVGNDKVKPKQQRSQSRPESEARRHQEQADREDRDRQQNQAKEPGTSTWHEVLKVSPNAGTQEIRRAYKSLMSQYHPDKVASLGPELKELCERKTKEINTAYDQAMTERSAT